MVLCERCVNRIFTRAEQLCFGEPPIVRRDGSFQRAGTYLCAFPNQDRKEKSYLNRWWYKNPGCRIGSLNSLAVSTDPYQRLSHFGSEQSISQGNQESRKVMNRCKAWCCV